VYPALFSVKDLKNLVVILSGHVVGTQLIYVPKCLLFSSKSSANSDDMTLIHKMYVSDNTAKGARQGLPFSLICIQNQISSIK
jgi:hypothetical protein